MCKTIQSITDTHYGGWFRKILEGFMWIWYSWSAYWFFQSPGGFHKISIYRVRVDFVKIKRAFVKLTFTKFKGSLQNCHPWIKGWFHQSLRDYFAKFITPSGRRISRSDPTVEKFGVTWRPSCCRKCTRISTKNWIIDMAYYRLKSWVGHCISYSCSQILQHQANNCGKKENKLLVYKSHLSPRKWLLGPRL